MTKKNTPLKSFKKYSITRKRAGELKGGIKAANTNQLIVDSRYITWGEVDIRSNKPRFQSTLMKRLLSFTQMFG